MVPVHEQARMAFVLQSGSHCLSAKDTLIYSEKSFSPKARHSKINTLDSRFRGKDDFFSVSLIGPGNASGSKFCGFEPDGFDRVEAPGFCLVTWHLAPLDAVERGARTPPDGEAKQAMPTAPPWPRRGCTLCRLSCAALTTTPAPG